VSDIRLVAVLGYSDARADGLHAICAARLRRAEREAGPDDVVLLSGWARGHRPVSEAELMASSWSGRAARIVLDEGARSTLANAVGVARVAKALAAREVVLVTSGWHGRRAAALLRAGLRGTSPTVTLALTDERAAARTLLREAACWTLVPVQRTLARLRADPPRRLPHRC
jgi:hypothetical protein